MMPIFRVMETSIILYILCNVPLVVLILHWYYRISVPHYFVSSYMQLICWTSHHLPWWCWSWFECKYYMHLTFDMVEIFLLGVRCVLWIHHDFVVWNANQRIFILRSYTELQNYIASSCIYRFLLWLLSVIFSSLTQSISANVWYRCWYCSFCRCCSFDGKYGIYLLPWCHYSYNYWVNISLTKKYGYLSWMKRLERWWTLSFKNPSDIVQLHVTDRPTRLN